MQDASSGTEDPPLVCSSANKLPPVNLAFSRMKGGVPVAVALRGAQVSVATNSSASAGGPHQGTNPSDQRPVILAPSNSENEHPGTRLQPMRLQEPPVSLSVAQTMTSDMYMSDHK
jgi:hypothetical protein